MSPECRVGDRPPPENGRSIRRGGRELDVAGATHTGYARKRNEDGFLADARRGLLVVADGMGGHPAGDVASRLALDTVDEVLSAERLASEKPRALIAEAIQTAQAVLLDDAESKRRHRGMGTTLVVAHVAPSTLHLTAGSVGDSRLYHLRDDRLTQVTVDHVVDHGRGRTLTQAIGSPEGVAPDVVTADLIPGDRVLACSDGLTDLVDEELIATTLAEEGAAREVCDRLVALALDRGGYDNVTVVVARIGTTPILPDEE